ncbi:radical SAM protein [Flavonifractor sp. An100]|uniref:coproporphyrinogen-III oxidase family protein n=1 Tax=Flavonifractor sp. An100 TaxID=1965538 RepID=UPI000B3A0D44|nr:radical SAM protein [Flavonifractor sp. An100]OUQ79419.1 coproporphyrinogen III oxidase [Flavonifractor sp. An100]
MSIPITAARMWLTRGTSPFRFTPHYDQPLPLEGARPLGLYVHIPFCRTLCPFCPYCKVVFEEELAQAYLNGLLNEIHLVGSQWAGRREVTSLYFGGGSPALLASRLGEVIAALEEHFIITDGIGVEFHPRDVTPDTLSLLQGAGVTRICIGVQSFQPLSLQSLCRERPDPQILGQTLAAVPFHTVSADFIFALPGQTFDHLRRDILLAEEMGANHLAFYPFIDFSFTPGPSQALSNGEKRALLDQLTAFLRERGYVRDSIWTFARQPGKGYSSMTRTHFLGFGCSATTLLQGQFKVNTFSISAYLERLSQGKLPTALTCRFTPRQRMVYDLFWRAYTTRISPSEFESCFGRSLDGAYGLELRLAQAMGWLRREGEDWVLTDQGAFRFHVFEGYYTLSYIDRMWGLMGREAFPAGMDL